MEKMLFTHLAQQRSKAPLYKGNFQKILIFERRVVFMQPLRYQ